MSRYLFVVPPFVGHVYPTVSVAQELTQRGHEVAWVSHSLTRHLLPANARFYEAAEELVRQIGTESLRQNTGMGWLPGLKAFWQDAIIPLCRGMMPDVEAAIEDFQPDALIVDQQALAGALAARRHGLPWATSSTSAQLHSNALDEYPKVVDWIQGLLSEVQIEAGLEPIPWPDRSPHLVLLYTTQELVGEQIIFPEHYRLVGPALGTRPEIGDFDWQKLTSRPRIFVSFGSLYGVRGGPLLNATAQALGGTEIQVIVSAPDGLIESPPPNFLVQSWVPQIELLARVDAVLTHAGSTVNEALSFGLPLIVAPIAQDQSIFANEVVQAGAGLRISFNRARPQEIRDSVTRVLQDPSFRAAAQRIQRSFQAAGGVGAAADAIEALA